jgi:hypothetical protein
MVRPDESLIERSVIQAALSLRVEVPSREAPEHRVAGPGRRGRLSRLSGASRALMRSYDFMEGSKFAGLALANPTAS